MAVDIGIPIGGVIQIQGANTAPINFKPLDGTVISEQRSPLNGQTVPNWNRDDYETVPYQIAPFDGSVELINSSKFATVGKSNLPEVALKWDLNLTFTPTGSAAATGDYNSNQWGSYSTIFPSTVVHMKMKDGKYIYSDASTKDFSGSGQTYVLIEATSLFRDTTLGTHKHTYRLTHDSAHSFTHTRADPVIGTNVYGYRNVSTDDAAITTTGSAIPSPISFDLKRKGVKAKWFMRIY